MRELLISAAIAACCAPVAAGATVSAAVTADAQHDKLAAELVGVLNSQELVRAQVNKMLGDTLPKAFAASPDFAAMEREHPGVTQAVIGAMRPIILNGMLARLPTLSARLTPIYAQAFTTAELHTLIDFYKSPTGARVIKAMGEGTDFSRLLGDMVANKNNAVTTEGVRAGVQSGVAEVIRTATPEDMKAMEALAATDAGKKLREIAPQIQAASVAWGSEPDPQLNAQVESAVKSAILDYVGKPKQ